MKGLIFCIDHFHKWRPIINSFANIKISLVHHQRGQLWYAYLYIKQNKCRKKIRCPERDLNPRHPDLMTGALTTELPRQPERSESNIGYKGNIDYQTFAPRPLGLGITSELTSLMMNNLFEICRGTHVLFRLLSFQFLTFEIKLLTARLHLKWTATYETDLTCTSTVATVWQKQCIPDWKALNGPGCRRTIKLKICGSEYSMFNIFYTVIHIFKYPEFQPPPPLATSLSQDLARGGGGWNSG